MSLFRREKGMYMYMLLLVVTVLLMLDVFTFRSEKRDEVR